MTYTLYYSNQNRESRELISLIRKMYLFELVKLKCVDEKYIPKNIKEIPSLTSEHFDKPLIKENIINWLITQGRNLRKNEKPNINVIRSTEQYINHFS